jgi:hypothetical protein
MNIKILKILGGVVISILLLALTLKYFLPVLVGILAIVGLLTVLYFIYRTYIDRISWKKGGIR